MNKYIGKASFRVNSAFINWNEIIYYIWERALVKSEKSDPHVMFSLLQGKKKVKDEMQMQNHLKYSSSL